MANTRKYWTWGAVAVLAAALPVAAVAGHGKAGLWKITTSTHMAGVHMPHLTAQQLAQMKAMGVHIPTGNSFTMQHCMTQADVNASSVPYKQRPNSGCKTENLKVVGHTITADTVCNGEMQGKGHFTVTYDSPEHYSGKMTFAGTGHGHPINSSNTFEGQWVSADCGNVHS